MPVKHPREEEKAPRQHKKQVMPPARKARKGEAEQSREAIINRAVDVIGDRETALRWLGTPVRALNYATPISRLHDSDGQSAVLKVLTQLEHGVL
jgi:uncharacterized protein (DUF2384 family)